MADHHPQASNIYLSCDAEEVCPARFVPKGNIKSTDLVRHKAWAQGWQVVGERLAGVSTCATTDLCPKHRREANNG